MDCVYYVKNELVIKYKSINGKINTIYTNSLIKKGYINDYPGQDSDDDIALDYSKYKEELERKIKENTYNKILYDNGKWIKDSYKQKYERYLLKSFKDIDFFIKIYKSNIAYEIV
jgi:hypothetical protein